MLERVGHVLVHLVVEIVEVVVILMVPVEVVVVVVVDRGKRKKNDFPGFVVLVNIRPMRIAKKK